MAFAIPWPYPLAPLRSVPRRHDAPNCAHTVRLLPGIATLYAVAETSYALCGDLSLAYQVFGDGPVELVFVYGPISHVELLWAAPEFKAFVEQLPRSVACSCSTRPGSGVGPGPARSHAG
jgi:hypothetical protein